MPVPNQILTPRSTSTAISSAGRTAAGFALRDYQQLAFDYILVALGDKPVFVAMPTGTGKAVAAAAVASHALARGRVLIVVHRLEIVGQLAEHARSWCGEDRVGIVMADRDECDKSVIVGSIQTLSSKPRLDRVLSASDEPFALVIVDECHHAAKGNTYGKLVENFPPGVPLLGFTATPRTRATSKFTPLFEVCCFERTIGQMSSAGWLAPLRQHRVTVPMELTGAPTAQQADSGETDYAPSWLSLQARRPDVLHALVGGTTRHIGDRTTLAFCVDVEHARDLADAYCEAGFPAAAIWGSMPAREREERLAAWRRGELRIITNFGVLTEGFDFPEIACIVMARPTRSHSLYIQMLGRGTRKAPGKDHCLVLDTTGLAPDYRQITFNSIVPADEDFSPPRRGERDPVLTMLDPRSAGRWKWLIAPKANGRETDVLAATVDIGRDLFIIGDPRSGLWRIVIQEPSGALMSLPGEWPQQQATALAGEWLRHHSNLTLSKKNAWWHNDEPSEGQLNYLRTLYPRDELVRLENGPHPLTKGYVSNLITQKLLANKARILRHRLAS